jgi:hypothetical protein
VRSVFACKCVSHTMRVERWIREGIKQIMLVCVDSAVVVVGVEPSYIEICPEFVVLSGIVYALLNKKTSARCVFRPVKATITDSQGSFTSSNFNCPNMVVYDKGNSVQLSWGGENIPLSKSSSPDTYVASQSKSGTTMKFVAYRSSSTRQIYLVICTTKGNGKSVDINFKP